MEIFPKVLVKTLWILTNTRPNSYFFDNVSVSSHTKEITTFRKLATTKRTALFLGLIWVLFSRHTLERVFECSVGALSPSVYFSYWYSSEVISEKDAERKGINERTGVMFFVLLFRACTANSMVANLALCGWLPDFKCSAALAPRALTDCLLPFRTTRWWVSDPLNKKTETICWILKVLSKDTRTLWRVFVRHSAAWGWLILLFSLLETTFQSVSFNRRIATD